MNKIKIKILPFYFEYFENYLCWFHSIQVDVFWVVTPCSDVVGYQRSANFALVSYHNTTLCLTRYHAVKFQSLLNWAPCSEDVLGSRSVAALILGLGTDWG